MAFYYFPFIYMIYNRIIISFNSFSKKYSSEKHILCLLGPLVMAQPMCCYHYPSPKYTFEKAKSYKSCSSFTSGSGVYTVPRGSFRQFMQVLEVGRNPPFSSTTVKIMDGCTAYPRTGSSFTPVANCRMCPRVTFPFALRPPETILYKRFLWLVIRNN